jgi:Ca-activated chloride channel homolog
MSSGALLLKSENDFVTRLTSLVAVDQTPSRPAGARLSRADVPLNLPAGWIASRDIVRSE